MFNSIKTKRIGSADEILQVDLTKFKGRCFYSTDLHGYYDLLHEKLKEVAFDSSKDILILGADMCDRGPDSKYVLDYLNEPWVYCIRGNHEQLLIQSFEDGFVGPAARCLYENGGDWVFELVETEKLQTVQSIYESFKSLPLAIELETKSGKRVGIVHAEVPYGDWDRFKGMTKAELDYSGQAVAQWARTKYDTQNQDFVKNIDVVLQGHTPTKSGNLELLGNQAYCDLGSFFRNKICFIEITDEFITGIENGKI